MSERLSREELDKISARAKTAREALMWLIRNYGNAMARRQYHQVEAPMNDVPALLANIAALEADNERLRATLAAKETVQRANEDEMSADNERLRDALLGIVGLPDVHAKELEIAVDALAALDEEVEE